MQNVVKLYNAVGVAARWLVLILALATRACFGDVIIDMTTIGNPGNAPDHPYPDQGIPVGEVDYTYQIGTYEVTVAQYTAFLNSVAQSDPYGLYGGGMGANTGYSGPIIIQTGTDGSYVYTAVPGAENQPVRFVSEFGAMRFCNWMANGQGSSSTETGSYDMAQGYTVTRGTNATWVVPTESEWYKAAYFDPLSGVYYTYPNSSNAVPAEPTDSTTPRDMNFGDSPYWAPNGPRQSYTAIGETTGHSPYGVYDMGGNVAEWTESLGEANYRITRGGAFVSLTGPLSSSGAQSLEPTLQDDYIGFRVAYVIVTAGIAVRQSGPATVLQGDQMSYAVSITNLGPSEAASVLAVDILPSQVSFDTTSTGDCIFTNGVLVCNFRTLASQSATSFTIAVWADGKPGMMTNMVAVSSPSDSNLVDNTASAITRIIKRPVPLDFDGDGASDVAVISRGTFNWFILGSAGGFISQQFGYPGVLPAPGDYDGDGKTDFGVYDPRRALWYVLQSSNGFVQLNFGSRGDVPVPADYDGDGKTDIASFSPTSGTWRIQQSTDGLEVQQFGFKGVVPLPADYDGDGRDDIAVFDPKTALWYLLESSAGFQVQQFGAKGMMPVPADYDGHGAANLALYDPASGMWQVQMPDGQVQSSQFGFSRAVPVPADYDGDGIADFAVYDPLKGDWYLLQSRDGFRSFNFGFIGAVPVEEIRR